ncbi:hypothetical protein Mapa_002475 [Marchantia paleacea]|nr:hypothetical protein Mapa_002475 [Marchantia paleacea]
MLLHRLISSSLKCSDSCRSSVKDGDVVLIYNLPTPSGIKVSRYSFKIDNRSSIQERPLCQVAVSGNPPTISIASVDFTGAIIEGMLKCSSSVHHVTTC